MKRRTAIIASLALIMALAVPGLSQAAEVAQGKCVKYDEATNVLVIEEYDINFSEEHKYGQPTGIESEYNLADAKVGITPEPGDILRIAYTLEGEKRNAIKVMNVSRQDLRKK